MVGKGHKDRYAQRMQPFQKTEDLVEWEMSLDEGFFSQTGVDPCTQGPSIQSDQQNSSTSVRNNFPWNPL